MDTSEIKKAAAERAKTLGVPYAGALTPGEAHELMKAGVKLVDVRTKPELQYVGRVPGSLAVEWQTWPGSKPNPDFISQLEDVTGKDEPLMFLCRSGSRSHHAAAAAMQAGWRETYNVLEGFEGDKDPQGHRGGVNGWRKAGLPWTQT